MAGEPARADPAIISMTLSGAAVCDDDPAVGAWWTCRRCGADNRRGHSSCWSCGARRIKGAAERRAQYRRKDARTVQDLLGAFQEIQRHRGSKLTKLAHALQMALQELGGTEGASADTELHDLVICPSECIVGYRTVDNHTSVGGGVGVATDVVDATIVPLVTTGVWEPIAAKGPSVNSAVVSTSVQTDLEVEVLGAADAARVHWETLNLQLSAELGEARSRADLLAGVVGRTRGHLLDIETALFQCPSSVRVHLYDAMGLANRALEEIRNSS